MRRIHHLIGLCALAGAGLLGCSPGEVGPGGGDDDTRLPEVKCEAPLATSGTFTTSVSPPPTAADGCVPTGVWSVAVTVMDQGDCTATNVGAQYVFDVAGDGRNRTMTLRNAPSGAEITTNIHAGGNGECEFSFEAIAPSAAAPGQYEVIELRPYTEPGLAMISGTGTFQLWSKHP